MEYISLGTSKLLEEYFYEIVNTDKKIKPAGGLWCSDYFAPTFNEWLDYIIGRPMYYTRYMVSGEPFLMNAVLVSLKDDAKIFYLDGKAAIEELEDNYKFDFEKLATEYDALYADPFSLFDTGISNLDEYRRVYSVKSLAVFDLSKIKEYKKAQVEIDPFDYTFGYDGPVYYETKVEDGTFNIEKESEDYKKFLEYLSYQLRDFIYHLRREHPDFPGNRIISIIKEELMNIIGPDLASYAAKKKLNNERLAYSLSTKTYKTLKKTA